MTKKGKKKRKEKKVYIYAWNLLLHNQPHDSSYENRRETV